MRLLCLAALAASLFAGELDRLPVLHQGRVKPFIVAAEEIVIAITGERRFAAPELQGGRRVLPAERLPASALLMAWMADPLAWGERPVIAVPYVPLQRALGLPGAWASSTELSAARAELEAAVAKRQQRERGLEVAWTARDESAWDAWARWWEFREAAGGRAVALAPLLFDAESERWAQRLLSLLPERGGRPWQERLRQAGPEPAALRAADPWLTMEDLVWRPDPLLAAGDGPWSGLLAAGARLRTAWNSGDPAALDAAATALAAEARRCGEARVAWLRAQGAAAVEDYPSERRLQLELLYRAARPFTWAWALFVLGGVLSAIALARGTRRAWWWAGILATSAACLACVLGLAARLAISPWGAVTNLYESVVFVSLVTGLLGLVLAATGRQPAYVVAAAVGAALCAMVGEAMPPDLGAHIGQLQPVLRSKFWLWLHVKVIVASYAAFVLAWVLGNWALARAAWRRQPVESGEAHAIARCLQVGLVLCVAGTVLGAIWADQAWGRFWGWDPKEVFALVIILVYLIPLHLRARGLVGPTALAAWAVHGFQSVVMSWYGVNFLLGVGLHAYATGSGFGSGGQLIVLPLIALQTALAVWWQWRARPRTA
ncbi:MAG: cytochrome c biogenesis protein CcsA [Planctomycetota bacterium]|nr:cytochrome c biogenesis protein CcsA [Planctomycetota bacterium]